MKKNKYQILMRVAVILFLILLCAFGFWFEIIH